MFISNRSIYRKTLQCVVQADCICVSSNKHAFLYLPRFRKKISSLSFLGHLPFVRTDRSARTVSKWNASVLRTVRTGSGQTGHALGVRPASSLAPAWNAGISALQAKELNILKNGSSYFTDLWQAAYYFIRLFFFFF